MADDSPTTPASDKPRVQTAARTVQILAVVAAHPASGIGATDLSAQLGVPRQVVYHLCHTLVAMQMLRKVRGGRYVLGLGVGPLAQGFRRHLMAPDFLSQYVHEASVRTGETAYAVGWIDDKIVVLATARGALPVHAAEVPHGFADDAHARASGKLLLAMAPDAEIERYVARHPLARRTPNTLATLESFKAEIHRIRQSWVSTEREEFAVGLSCLAVPIGPTPSALVLGVSAPTQRFDENRDRYVAFLRAVAASESP